MTTNPPHDPRYGTNPATAELKCDKGKFLIGADVVACNADGLFPMFGILCSKCKPVQHCPEKHTVCRAGRHHTGQDPSYCESARNCDSGYGGDPRAPGGSKCEGEAALRNRESYAHILMLTSRSCLSPKLLSVRMKTSFGR